MTIVGMLVILRLKEGLFQLAGKTGYKLFEKKKISRLLFLQVNKHSRSKRTRVDLEMYWYLPKDFSKTGRYHSAMMDCQLPPGSLPAGLPDSAVILFCTYDPIGYGEPVYRFRTKSETHPEYDYKEGRLIIIVTNQGYERAPDELEPIIYLLTRNPEPIDDPLYRRIQEKVKLIKTSPDRKKEIMPLIEKNQTIEDEGHKKETKKAVRDLFISLRANQFTDVEALEMLINNLPVDEKLIKKGIVPKLMKDSQYRKIRKKVKRGHFDLECWRQLMLLQERNWMIREEGMQKGLAQSIEKGLKKERQKAIRTLVKISRSIKQTDDEILEMLMDLYPSSEKMIRKIMQTH